MALNTFMVTVREKMYCAHKTSEALLLAQHI
jgi:hypothetical protein